MHLKRWITAIIALPLLILLIGKGGAFLFAAFICLVCLISMFEYFRIVFNNTEINSKGIIPLLGILSGIGIICAAYIKSFEIIAGLLIFNLIVAGLFSLREFSTNNAALEIVSKQVQGVIYIPLLLSSLVLIRNGNDGVIWIFFMLLLVFVCDTGAFYAGSYLGRHKLCPAVSPGKTVEGFIGGIVFCACAGGLFKYFFLPQLNWGLSFLLFISVGVIGPVGDLFESVLKRTADIKDSGNILPGHGGMLDRIDALIFTAPIVYLFKDYIF